MKAIFMTIAAVSCCLALFVGGSALAQTTNWMDELSGSVKFYQSRYPGNSNEPADWGPYLTELNLMKKAAIRGDQQAVRVGMEKWFKMLKNREHGINPKAADELFH